jgi:hypothetical protein
MISSIAEALQDLPDYKAYVRTLVQNDDGAGQPSGPHLVSTYPPFLRTMGNADRARVIRTSTERWTKPRAELEAKLVRFLKRGFKGPGK